MTAGPHFRVGPGGALSGRVSVPGDKSISHRALILGALADGRTTADGFLDGADCLATRDALRALGVDISGPESGRVSVAGAGPGGLSAPAGPLDLGNSGTSMRLLAGVLAGQPFASTLTGDASLTRRPMGRIIEPLRLMGAEIEGTAGDTAPLRIGGARGLHGIDYALPVASAQLKSCLLLAGLHARGATRVREPGPSRDHTERMLAAFGADVEHLSDGVRLTPGHRLHGQSLSVPGDLSSAAFLLVGAAIAPGSDLTVEGVGVNPTRTGVIEILREMGADIELGAPREQGGEPVADVRIRHRPLRGTRVPARLVPLAIDELPAVFVAAAAAQGETVVTGAEELRVKESDRIDAMATGLSRLGADVTPAGDGMRIRGGRLRGGRVESRGDHRVAMALAVAALAADEPVTVEDCGNVETSFPGFEALLARCGLDIRAVQELAE